MNSAPSVPEAQPGDLSWRLSSHPITLLFFLGFRISALAVYLLGLYVTNNFVLIFIITTILLAADFYYLKNIAGRRLVGLRWWSEVPPLNQGGTVATAEQNASHWVFESADPSVRATQNATDRRFFWYALYVQPVLWAVLAVWAIIMLKLYWLTLVVIAVTLSVTNTLAFSRCDKFSQASALASGALYSGGLASTVAGGLMSRIFSGR